MIKLARRLKRAAKTILGSGPPQPSFEAPESSMVVPLLASGLLHDKRTLGERLCVVQIGANDGVKDDPIKHILNEHDVDALLVEPQPNCVERLHALYESVPGVRIVNKAIASSEGTLSLYRFADDEEDGRKISVFCSADREHLDTWKTRLGLRTEIAEFRVETIPLTTLLMQAEMRHIDLLMTDTEGWDFEILFPFLKDSVSLPSYIVFEKCNLSVEQLTALIRRCRERGGAVWDLGMDAFVSFVQK